MSDTTAKNLLGAMAPDLDVGIIVTNTVTECAKFRLRWTDVVAFDCGKRAISRSVTRKAREYSLWLVRLRDRSVDIEQ